MSSQVLQLNVSQGDRETPVGTAGAHLLISLRDLLNQPRRADQVSPALIDPDPADLVSFPVQGDDTWLVIT